MLLVDILEHVTDPFPSGAKVHLNAEIYQNPDTSKKVMLLGLSMFHLYRAMHP